MFDVLYRIDSNPLERITEVVIGEDYCTSFGTTIRYIEEKEIEIIRSSPLVEGELVENLTSPLLCLFWKLRRQPEPFRG